jgi:hypothetical protein
MSSAETKVDAEGAARQTPKTRQEKLGQCKHRDDDEELLQQGFWPFLG